MIIGITGHKGSGKTTVGDHLVDAHGFIKIEIPAPITADLCVLNPWIHVETPAVAAVVGEWCRFADLVNHIGIDEAKKASREVRRLQQAYGRDVIADRHDPNRWIDLAVDRIRRRNEWGDDPDFVLPNVRAANEAAICDLVIRVVRPGHELLAGDHAIEVSIEALAADHVISNDGTLADLRQAIDMCHSAW